VIDQDLLVRSVIDATTKVFSTMLYVEVKCIGVAAGTPARELGLISLVGITGDWGGSGVFCCTPALASIICSRMLGTELNPGSPLIDEEVLDVVAETTNMIIGNINNDLEPITGPLAISVPMVIHGRNFQFRNGGGPRAVALDFTAEGEPFEVRISLDLSNKQSPVRSRIPILGLAQV
jgi:CheY-specific phosphatase CheX